MKTSRWFVLGLLAVIGAGFAGAGFVTAQTAADVDFNGNGEVDFPDFVMFAAKFNTREGAARYEARYDIDGSGEVGFSDFLAFARLFGEKVAAPELPPIEIAQAEGMPGTLIELAGQFDPNTAYRVRFDAVQLPVYARDTVRITAMVPVLPAGPAPVRVVDEAGRVSAPATFRVLALPEPRMDAGQLGRTVARVGYGIGNVLAPLTAPDSIFSAADAALFNGEMAGLNAAWGVLGERIAALPAADAALLAHLLDNSGVLGILEGLGRIENGASIAAGASHAARHRALFRADVASFLLGNAGAAAGPAAAIAALAPGGRDAAAIIASIDAISDATKTAIDAIFPTDLQSLKVEISPTPVAVEDTSDVTFYGDFATESDAASAPAGGVLRDAVEDLLDDFLKIPGVSAETAEIVGFVTGILTDSGIAGFDWIGPGAAISPALKEVPLDISLYKLSVPDVLRSAVPSLPAGAVEYLLERFGIDATSYDPVEVEDAAVAVYDTTNARLTGIAAGETLLTARALRFVEWDFALNAFGICRWETVETQVTVTVAESVNGPLVVASIRNLTNHPESDVSPVWAPDGARIAFLSTRDGNYEIYAMDSDGSNPRNLTSHESNEEDPSWSPDGRRIAFVSNRDGNIDIHVMGSDGSNPRNLTNDQRDDFNPAWSPDGRHIAFESMNEGNFEIYVMGSDGSNPRNLTNHEREDRNPVWSPDGRRIAFVSDRDDNFEIYVMGADGSNPRNLTGDETGVDESPAWSPDGRRIAFESLREWNYEIFVMGSDGSNPRNLTNNQRDDNRPVWSPDGRHLAFTSWGEGNSEIYLMGSDGSGPRKLTDDPTGVVDSPAWSPDGLRIAFVSDSDGNSEVYVITFRNGGGK